VTEIDFGSIKTNFKPVLHAIHGRRPRSKTQESYAVIYYLRGILDANV
jgi:hypothetical protein